MKRPNVTGTRALSLITALSFVVLMSSMAFAAATTASSAKDEKKLTVGITMLNSDVKLPSGEKVLTKQLSDEFGVNKDKITSLKGKNLTYGDIAVVLALADKMDGGVNDTNINKIVGMKPSSSSGWSKVAKNLNLDIAEVADKVSTLEDHAHSGIKEAALESMTGHGAGGGELDSSGSGGSMSESESGVSGDESMGGTYGGGTGGSADSGENPSSGTGGGY